MTNRSSVPESLPTQFAQPEEDPPAELDRQAQQTSSLGRFLFRFRGAIGLAAFAVVYLFSRPVVSQFWLGAVPILAGMALRVWATGHLGPPGRASQVSAAELVTSGPYRLVRNPLYVGNFLLVLGGLTALGTRWWLGLTVLVLFVVEYALIVRAEEALLCERFGSAYMEYRRRVPAILPRGGKENDFISSSPGQTVRFSWNRVRAELATLALVAGVYALVLLRLRLAPSEP